MGPIPDSSQRSRCKICGRGVPHMISSGRNSAVPICRVCQNFYRRTVTKRRQYICKSNADQMATDDAKKMICRDVTCKACRVEKCVAFGLSLQEIRLNTFPGSQIAVKSCDEFLPQKDYFRPEGRTISDATLQGSDIDCSLLEPAETVCAVEMAVHTVFGDQIAQWSIFMDDVYRRGKYAHRPEIELDDMLAALNYHSVDNIRRTVEFASHLPGFSALQASVWRCTFAGWKWLLYIMMHQAPFRTKRDSFVTVGPEKLHFSRHWQERILEQPFIIAMYQICNQFRDIGLTQTERYLFMAITMLEPGDDDDDIQLRNLHHYYCSVLLDTIKERCTNCAQLAAIYRRIDDFFDTFKMALQLHDSYYIGTSRCPPFSVAGKQLVLKLRDQIINHQSLEFASIKGIHQSCVRIIKKVNGI